MQFTRRNANESSAKREGGGFAMKDAKLSERERKLDRRLPMRSSIVCEPFMATRPRSLAAYELKGHNARFARADLAQQRSKA